MCRGFAPAFHASVPLGCRQKSRSGAVFSCSGVLWFSVRFGGRAVETLCADRLRALRHGPFRGTGLKLRYNLDVRGAPLSQAAELCYSAADSLGAKDPKMPRGKVGNHLHCQRCSNDRIGASLRWWLRSFCRPSPRWARSSARWPRIEVGHCMMRTCLKDSRLTVSSRCSRQLPELRLWCRWRRRSPLKAATYNGIFTSNIRPVSSECPSGNRTWLIAPSLAVCRGCLTSVAPPFPCGSSHESTASCSLNTPLGAKADVTEASAFQVFNSSGAFATPPEDTAFVSPNLRPSACQRGPSTRRQ